MIENYIALDLETTGLHPSEDRILEIGAVKVVNGEITDRYETLVNPGMAISHRIQALTEKKASLVATGPNAPVIVRYCNNHIIYDKNLVMDGLYQIYRKNTI